MTATKTMGTGWGKLAVVACAMVLLGGAEPSLAQVPGRCELPVSQRAGCYVTATEPLGAIPAGPVYWHLYNYSTRAAAEAARGPNSTVVGSFDKVWLYTIAEQGWQPSNGERVAVIGPLAMVAGRSYLETPDGMTIARAGEGAVVPEGPPMALSSV
jgi:hypothetical protein